MNIKKDSQTSESDSEVRSQSQNQKPNIMSKFGKQKKKMIYFIQENKNSIVDWLLIRNYGGQKSRTFLKWWQGKKINPEYYSQQKYPSITNKKWWYFQFKKKTKRFITRKLILQGILKKVLQAKWENTKKIKHFKWHKEQWKWWGHIYIKILEHTFILGRHKQTCIRSTFPYQKYITKTATRNKNLKKGNTEDKADFWCHICPQGTCLFRSDG